MNTYLFLFTIGPVQSFIRQARKTRDLHAGSQILSELVIAGLDACQKATEHHKGIMYNIFPPAEDNNKKEEISSPNRFIVKLSFEVALTEIILRQIAGNIEGGVEYAVREKFREMARQALKNAEVDTEPNGFWQQIDQHLDIHWAFQPISDGLYREAYLALERLLGSVKNLRPFRQYTYQEDLEFGERGRKCSLDGENNALFFGDGSNKNYITSNGAKTVKTANENEGLSAVSLVKRYWKEIKFPSTAGIATMNLNFDGQFKPDILSLHFNGSPNVDEQLYFEENLTEQYFIKNGLKKFISKLPEIRNIHKQIFSNKKLCSYYAVLSFDGDSMGKWLSGNNLAENADLEAFHMELSAKLSGFAQKHIREVVDNGNKGKTVYAGGDDYLGFINLDHLFEVVEKLRSRFHEEVNMKLINYKSQEKELTFSAGIVIAHYKEPLGVVIEKAREMEKAAKEQGGRNAFGLAVLKASGEVQQTVYNWDDSDNSPDSCSNWLAIKSVFEGLKKEVYSNKFITNLSRELYELAGIELDGLGKVPPLSMVEEIKRLVNKAKIDKESPIDIFEDVKRLFKHRRQGKPEENFVHCLHIIDFLHRKMGIQ